MLYKVEGRNEILNLNCLILVFVIFAKKKPNHIMSGFSLILKCVIFVWFDFYMSNFYLRGNFLHEVLLLWFVIFLWSQLKSSSEIYKNDLSLSIIPQPSWTLNVFPPANIFIFFYASLIKTNSLTHKYFNT